MLLHYIGADGFALFKRTDLKQYEVIFSNSSLASMMLPRSSQPGSNQNRLHSSPLNHPGRLCSHLIVFTSLPIYFKPSGTDFPFKGDHVSSRKPSGWKPIP